MLLLAELAPIIHDCNNTSQFACRGTVNSTYKDAGKIEILQCLQQFFIRSVNFPTASTCVSNPHSFYVNPHPAFYFRAVPYPGGRFQQKLC